MTLSKTEIRLSMPFAEWPAQDRKLWLDAAKAHKFCLKPKPLRSWAPRSRQNSLLHYAQWLQFIALENPERLNEAAAERMNPPLLAAFLLQMSRRVTAGTLQNCVNNFYGIMTSIAPDRDWSWLCSLRTEASGYADLHPPAAKAFIHANELMALGRRLIVDAHDEGGHIVDLAAFRDGLILVMLIMIPVRISQFSAVQLERHWRRGAKGGWEIHWDAEETKTRREDNHPVSQELAELLEIYLTFVRPALRARTGRCPQAEMLWIGNSGMPIGPQSIRNIIKARTSVALGKAINPHIFRSSAATTYAIELPIYAREAAAILGHANFKTTQDYYMLGRRAQALKIAHAALAGAAS